MDFYDTFRTFYSVGAETLALCRDAEAEAAAFFGPIDETAAVNSLKVLSAMQEFRLSDIHFTSVTGYGYNDPGREALENIYARVFESESGLVRPQLVSGTHALSTALSGNLKHGDTLLMPAGAPYDTLTKVIGIKPAKGSLAEHGVKHILIDLKPDGSFDYRQIEAALTEHKITMAAIQRSRGYSLRRAFNVGEISALIKFIKDFDNEVVCMVDNCYGEFVETAEPGGAGADLTVGSLIKNPGGGLSPAGGYICGKEELVEACARRLTAPGLGKDVGPTLGLVSKMLQGLFMAPGVVAAAMKAAVFASAVFKRLGYGVSPEPGDSRSDIVQAIRFGDAEKAAAFVRGVQQGSPVDSFVVPQPAPMPGYDCDIVMAAGTFTQGSSIEFSADAPLREPYAAYMQGALSYDYAKTGIILAVDYFLKETKNK